MITYFNNYNIKVNDSETIDLADFVKQVDDWIVGLFLINARILKNILVFFDTETVNIIEYFMCFQKI